jgi:DNA-binding response OmpR family regulator
MTTAMAKFSVLTVEDEPDVADLVRYHLEQAGYDVRLASTGVDAIQQARQAPPSLILLDLMVPEINGWEVCRRLKGTAETREIPVIMLTARADEGDKILGLELGTDDYVTKPFSPREELLDLVWGQDGFVEPRTVDVHVARLRAKFFSAGLPDPGIETVRGVGYRLGEPD